MSESDTGPSKTLIDDLISEPVVVCAIILNALTAVYFYAYPEQLSGPARWMGWIDIGCIAYFVLEAGLKIYRLGPRAYFGSHWNKFDFAVTAASAPVLLAPLFGLPTDMFGQIAILRVLRLLRLLRALRVSKAASVMRFLNKPVFTLLVLVLLHEVIDAIEVNHDAKVWALQGFIFAMIMVAAWAVERLYTAMHEQVLIPKTSAAWNIDPTLLTFLRIFVQLAVFFAGFIIALDAIGHDPFHLLAGLGIGGMAVAFAARDLVANLIGGILIFLNKPFRIGDRIVVCGSDGWVTSIGLRETAVRDFYGKKHIVPNKTFMETIVQNIDDREFYLIRIQVKLHHEMTADQAERALEVLGEIAEADDLVLETYWTCFDTIEQDGLAMSLWYYIERWRPVDEAEHGGEFHKMFKVQSRMNIAVMRAFEKAGIRLALPIEVHREGTAASGLFGGQTGEPPLATPSTSSPAEKT